MFGGEITTRLFSAALAVVVTAGSFAYAIIPASPTLMA